MAAKIKTNEYGDCIITEDDALEFLYTNPDFDISKLYFEDTDQYKKALDDIGVDLPKIKSIPKHDILCAGFPCQPFSKAGLANGFNHKIAGKMFFYLIKIIKYHKPKYLFLENVPNLIGHNNGETWQYMKKKISKKNLPASLKGKYLRKKKPNQ